MFLSFFSADTTTDASVGGGDEDDMVDSDDEEKVFCFVSFCFIDLVLNFVSF